MVCAYCDSKTQVTNSRWQRRSNQVWRRRQCLSCMAVFTTHEAIDLTSTLIVASRGSTGPFLPDKLYTEVLLAIQDRKDCFIAAREVTNTVIKQLLKLPEKPLFSPDQISQAAGDVLKRLDKRAYLRYVAEHPSLQA
jgi:transcriptional regulator NrdR family protein